MSPNGSIERARAFEPPSQRREPAAQPDELRVALAVLLGRGREVPQEAREEDRVDRRVGGRDLSGDSHGARAGLVHHERGEADTPQVAAPDALEDLPLLLAPVHVRVRENRGDAGRTAAEQVSERDLAAEPQRGLARRGENDGGERDRERPAPGNERAKGSGRGGEGEGDHGQGVADADVHVRGAGREEIGAAERGRKAGARGEKPAANVSPWRRGRPPRRGAARTRRTVAVVSLIPRATGK